MNKLLFCFLLVSQLTRAQPAALDSIRRQAKVTGLQLIYSNHSQRQAYALGVSRDGPGQAIAVTEQTVFQAASLSKSVVAYATLRLMDRGLIELDKPLLKYVTEPRLAAQTDAGLITARMVLSHTSGLPNWATNPLDSAWVKSPLTLRFKPGSHWAYSGEGFALLQKVLEHQSGLSLDSLIRREVLVPLGMNQSHFVWQKAYDTLAARGHSPTGIVTPLLRFTRANAAYSLLTTASDYNRFVQVLMSGQGLKARTYRMMLTPSGSTDPFGKPKRPFDSAVSWGLGVGLQKTAQGLALWHWGDNGDFKGFFIAYPKQRRSVVYLTNSANGSSLAPALLPFFLGVGPYPALSWLKEDE